MPAYIHTFERPSHVHKLGCALPVDMHVHVGVRFRTRTTRMTGNKQILTFMPKSNGESRLRQAADGLQRAAFCKSGELGSPIGQRGPNLQNHV